MTSVFGLPCTPLPPMEIIFGGSERGFFKSLFMNPNFSNKHEAFFYSKLFFLTFVWYVIFRIPREMAQMLNVGFGVNFSILLIANMVFAIEMFRRYGYECTLFLIACVYFVYIGVLALLPVVAKSEIADVIPEIKKLPVAKRKPGLNHCRRLAVCRATPVFDNHRFQVGKHAKCMTCATQSEPKRIIYDESDDACKSTQRDVDAEFCYKCSSTKASISGCSFSEQDCANVNMVLDFIDPGDVKYTQRSKICKDSNASLCWFAPDSAGSFTGWNNPQNLQSEGTEIRRAKRWSLDDSTANGEGYPTKEICERENNTNGETWPANATKPSNYKTCQKLTKCQETNETIARCICKQYRDVRQYKNPCEFLEENCDERSIAYTEAVLKLQQSELSTEDIIDSGDAANFLNAIDAVAQQLP